MYNTVKDIEKAIEEQIGLCEEPIVDDKEFEVRDKISGSHYRQGYTEVIDLIAEFKLDFITGNTLKYLLRANYKGTRKKDLFKAMNYLHYELYGNWITPNEPLGGWDDDE